MRSEDKTAGNTFIFSEHDIQGQPRRSYIKKDPLPPLTQGNNGVKKFERGQRRPWKSRTLAKQTKLAAAATRDASWVAIDNDDYKRTMSERRVAELNNKNTIEILTGDARLYGGNVLKTTGKIISRPGHQQRTAGFENFIVSIYRVHIRHLPNCC